MRSCLIVLQFVLLAGLLLLTIPFLFFIPEARFMGVFFLFMLVAVALWTRKVLNTPAEEFNRKMKEAAESRKRASARSRLPGEFHLRQLQRDQRVALDSLQIISNSYKIDTVLSRLPILQQALLGLVPEADSPGYEPILWQTIEKFKIDYYDKPVEKWWVEAVLKPGELLYNWEDFTQKALIAAFKRYAKEHQNHINELKTPKGKVNRVQKVIEELDVLIRNFSDTEVLAVLVEMRQAFEQLKHDLEKGVGK